MTVEVSFDPKSLGIYFMHKTIEEFSGLKGAQNGTIYRHYDNILLPSHGFCLIISK